MEEISNNNSEVAMLDNMIEQAGIYRTTEEYKDLLKFIARLRNFAPFNAMLLQVQKPGLRFAASETDWYERFGRTVKQHSRPLLIMWPFCPVALVYDVNDTEGKELPIDVASAFRASGDMNEELLTKLFTIIERKNISIERKDYGDSHAGSICVSRSYKNKNGEVIYEYNLLLNKNHTTQTQFATLSHELAHLYLGHLGGNKKLKIPTRDNLSHAINEIEAESVAFLVCQRNGVIAESKKYLSQFTDGKPLPLIRVHQIVRAAGQVEKLLGLGYTAKFEKNREFRGAYQDKKGSPNVNIDHELILAVAKVGAFSLLKGSVKFVPWVRNVLATARDVGINVRDITPVLKSAYGAIAYNPSSYEISNEIAEKMDLPCVVSRVDIHQIIKEDH